MKKVETIVIGAGVVGLAIARKLLMSGYKVLVLEANKEVGREASVQNSAVIHAGIYYPEDSLKARFCVQGQKLLYDYCDSHNIHYKKIGKLIVAVNEGQLVELEELQLKAKRNGVDDIKMLTAEDIKRMEPQIFCKAALFSPSTGIINLKELIAALAADVEAYGGEIQVASPVVGGTVLEEGFRLLVGEDKHVIESQYLVNIAGLWAPKVSRNIKGVPAGSIPKEYFTKGSYFKYKKPSPFSHLIYPVPEKAGLGIHATVDILNEVRFGPDVEWIDNLDYHVTTDKQQKFLDAIRTYFPQIQDTDIVPEFSGIRPKIKPKEEQPQDFSIQSFKDHGIKGFVPLYGIESPGLTASLAIADYVERLFGGYLSAPGPIHAPSRALITGKYLP